METKVYLANYYERYDKECRPNSKQGMAEYAVAMKYVDKYLRTNKRVLKIGSVTDRYSHATEACR